MTRDPTNAALDDLGMRIELFPQNQRWLHAMESTADIIRIIQARVGNNGFNICTRLLPIQSHHKWFLGEAFMEICMRRVHWNQRWG